MLKNTLELSDSRFLWKGHDRMNNTKTRTVRPQTGRKETSRPGASSPVCFKKPSSVNEKGCESRTGRSSGASQDCASTGCAEGGRRTRPLLRKRERGTQSSSILRVHNTCQQKVASKTRHVTQRTPQPNSSFLYSWQSLTRAACS